MNLRWFYVSLLCLFVILFNHTVLAFAIPDDLHEGVAYWRLVFLSDGIFFVAALVSMLAALFVAPRVKAPPGPPDRDGVESGATDLDARSDASSR